MRCVWGLLADASIRGAFDSEMNSSDPETAERIYTEYRNHGMGGWGPFIHYEDPERQSRLDAAIDQCLSDTAIVLVDERTIWLPSAWHAVLFFLRAERYQKHRSPPSHQLYRGQADPAWPLVCSFDRVSARDRNREWTASTLFAAYLARRLYYPYLNIAAYAAVARHYGFASKLMDWTVDPAVAVWFACESAGVAKDGRVFSLQVAEVVDKGLEVWCPPPFCRRVYSQLGVFLRPPPVERLDLYARCQSVRFPKPSSDRPFRQIRDGDEVPVLSTHPWLEQSALWARTVAAELPELIEDTDNLMPVVERGMSEVPPAPAELLSNSAVDQYEWGTRVLDLYHWLFIFITKDGMGTLVDMESGLPIVGCNRTLTRLAAEAVAFTQSCVPGEHYQKLEEPLIALLKQAGPHEGPDDDPLGAATQ